VSATGDAEVARHRPRQANCSERIRTVTNPAVDFVGMAMVPGTLLARSSRSHLPRGVRDPGSGTNLVMRLVERCSPW
jgi:hypothetical protein